MTVLTPQPTAPASADRATEFDRTTAVEPTDVPGEYAAQLDELWTSPVGVHGGYMCAVAVRAAEHLVSDRQVRTMTTSFLRAGRVGAATVIVGELRRGRSISTVVADLVQGDRVILADDEWLVASFEIDDSTGGLAVEHGRIVDPEGLLVVESFQTRSTAEG